jgi:hypothetical protein
MTTLATIDVGTLAKVIAASLIAGLVIVTAFSLCLYGADTFFHERREGRATRATPFAVLAAISGVIFASAVVLGFIIMLSK